jgi:hypothetical protein
MKEPFKKEEMNTLVNCSNKLLSEGFTENFIAKEKGLEAPSTKKVYDPDEVKIISFYRFEGESDPADNAILYAIETNDGVKGMLIDAYGPYANPAVAKFIAEVQDISKREPQDEE